MTEPRIVTFRSRIERRETTVTGPALPCLWCGTTRRSGEPVLCPACRFTAKKMQQAAARRRRMRYVGL